MPQKRRKSLRLKGYDYRQPGYYFVTSCSFGREQIFGEIVSTEFVQSAIGIKIAELWEWLPEHFLNVA
jgi:hypothetical protein